MSSNRHMNVFYFGFILYIGALQCFVLSAPIDESLYSKSCRPIKDPNNGRVIGSHCFERFKTEQRPPTYGHSHQDINNFLAYGSVTPPMRPVQPNPEYFRPEYIRPEYIRSNVKPHVSTNDEYLRPIQTRPEYFRQPYVSTSDEYLRLNTRRGPYRNRGSNCRSSSRFPSRRRCPYGNTWPSRWTIPALVSKPKRNNTLTTTTHPTTHPTIIPPIFTTQTWIHQTTWTPRPTIPPNPIANINPDYDNIFNPVVTTPISVHARNEEKSIMEDHDYGLEDEKHSEEVSKDEDVKENIVEEHSAEIDLRFPKADTKDEEEEIIKEAEEAEEIKDKEEIDDNNEEEEDDHREIDEDNENENNENDNDNSEQDNNDDENADYNETEKQEEETKKDDEDDYHYDD